MLPVSMPGDAPRNPEPIGSCRPLVYPNLDDAHHGVKAAPPGPAAARRHKRLRSVASSKANMFAIADRRHPVVMLERPLVEQNTRLTQSNLGADLSVLPSLRGHGDIAMWIVAVFFGRCSLAGRRRPSI